jgi:hypothetical protein
VFDVDDMVVVGVEVVVVVIVDMVVLTVVDSVVLDEADSDISQFFSESSVIPSIRKFMNLSIICCLLIWIICSCSPG